MLIDVDDLRDDMRDYYGTAMTSGFPMAMMELGRVDAVSDEELVRMAVRNGVDLRKYAVNGNED